MNLAQPQTKTLAGSDPSLAIDETILELLPVGVTVCDADGILVRYNRKASELWGQAPRPGNGEFRFCGAHGIFWPDGRPLERSEEPVAEVLRTGQAARNLEVLIEQPNGVRIWALATIEPIRDAAGRVSGAISCFQDITARKETEEKLRDSQERLKTIIDTSPECIKLVAGDGTLLQMNPAGLRILEAEGPHEVVGSCAFDLIAPECRDLWRSHHERVCQGESLAWEFDLIGRKGTRRHMETHAVPLALPDGGTAQLAVTRDITERKRVEEKLRESERAARELLEALPAAVYTTDAAGRITFYNQAAVELWGHRPELGTMQWCGSWRLYWPDGAPLPHDQCPMAVCLREGRPVRGAEAIAERPDGTRVPFVPYPTPLRDPAGNLVGGVNMLIDITDRRHADERQRLLINELNHRVKNTLATVQSIAAQSFRGETERPAFGWFEGRLLALSRTHDVLTRENWESASLHEVLAQATAPLCAQNEDRFDVRGPDLRLPPQMALALSLAVHELCTNASKYGALSNEAGRISIQWHVYSRKGTLQLSLIWEEHGGPAVVPPEHKGFGSRLIQRGLARELDGNVSLEYRSTGVVCRIDAPIPGQ